MMEQMELEDSQSPDTGQETTSEPGGSGMEGMQSEEMQKEMLLGDSTEELPPDDYYTDDELPLTIFKVDHL